MSNSQFLDPDPVEQYYSFVPDDIDGPDQPIRETVPEHVVVKNMNSFAALTLEDYAEAFCKAGPVKAAESQYFSRSVKPFESQKPTSIPSPAVFTLTRRNSTGTTSEEGSDDEVAKPMYKNYQLLGDSQFVRFAKQILGMDGFVRSVSYCVSGQRIQGLYSMLVSKEHKLHQNVIVMIGTNDLRQNSALTRMKESYSKLLELLKELAKKIVLVTIPPIQVLADSIQHWRTFEGFNNFILQQHNGKQIFVVDFGQHLTGYTGLNGCKEYFEEVYAKSHDRKDLMHLNKKGFQLLKFLLDLHYFNCVD